MQQETLTEFFQWATLISFIIYLFTAIMGMFFRDVIYSMHTRWFNLPRPSFDIIIYAYIGIFKVLWILFFLVPYLSLLIMK